MILHVSIETKDPEQVSKAIAEISGGVAAPLDRLVHGSWIAYCEKNPLSAIEVFPLGTDIRRSSGDDSAWNSAWKREASPSRPTATHVALGTDLSESEVMSVISKNGWDGKHVLRGDRFGLIEMWITDHLVVEWFTKEMRIPYEATMRRAIEAAANPAIP
jgi:hypothetical protein